MGEWADSRQEKMTTHNIKFKDVQCSDCQEYRRKNHDYGEAGWVRKPQIRKVLVNQHRYVEPYTTSNWKPVLSKGMIGSYLY